MKIDNYCNLSTAEQFAAYEWADANYMSFKDRARPTHITSVGWNTAATRYEFAYKTESGDTGILHTDDQQTSEISELHHLYSIARRDLNDNEIAVLRIFRELMAHDWAVDGYMNDEAIAICSERLDLTVDQVKGYYSQLLSKGFARKEYMPINGVDHWLTTFPEDPEAARK